MAKDRIDQIEAYVRLLMSTAAAPDLRIAHDFKHVDRVRGWALIIGEAEGLDIELVEAAALLHDIGLTCLDAEQRSQHGQAGAELAARFLDDQQLFNPGEIEVIADAIRCHSLPDGGGVIGAVLRDADKLDALGAVGLMRAFTSQHAKPEYDPGHPKGSTWQMTMGEFEKRFSEGRGVGEYILDQVNFQISFYDELHTATARQIGKPLVDFMRAYVVQLDSEIHAAQGKSAKTTDPKRVVERGYDQVAYEYARLEGRVEWPRMRWLSRMLGRLGPGSSVLDLGCGSGDPADIEIAQKHKVTGVDISQAQIDLALRNVPAGRFIHGDAGSVEFPADSFDAVVSFYTLEHIPRDEHETILRRIHDWLRPGGFLLISTEAGEAEGVIAQWLGAPMYFSCFDPETVKQLVCRAGFEIVETAIETQVEQSTEIPYLWVLARKP